MAGISPLSPAVLEAIAEPRPTDYAAGQVNALRAQALRQQLAQQGAAQNALRRLYATPGNIDPASGLLTPGARAQLMTAAPAGGLNYLGAAAKIQDSMTRARDTDLAFRLKFSNAAMTQIGLPALEAYNRAKARGMSESQAVRAAQQVYSGGLNSLKTSGAWSPELVGTIPPNFDPARVYSNATIWKIQQAQRNFAERQRHDVVLEGQGARRLETARRRAQDEPPLQAEVQEPDGTRRIIPVYRAAAPGGAYVDATTGQPVQGHVVNVGKPSDITTLSMSLGDLGAGAPGARTGGHGAAYLQSLPPNISAQVKALADGRMQFPSGFALRSPYWQQMLQAVAQYDPSFDAVNYNARYRARADFTSGAAARNVTALDTAIGHAGTLLSAAASLENGRFPLYNTVANMMETAKGDPRVKRFNVARQAFVDELERVFRGSGGSMTEIRQWERQFDSSNSPAQIRAAIREGVELMGSRLDALQQQYRRGMGTTSGFFDLLTPTARRTLAQLPGGLDIINDLGGTPPHQPPSGSGAASPATASPTAIPPAAASPAAAGVSPAGAPGAQSSVREIPMDKAVYDKLPSGTRFRFPSDPPGQWRTKP